MPWQPIDKLSSVPKAILKKIFVCGNATYSIKKYPTQRFLSPFCIYIDSKIFTAFLKNITLKKLKNDLPTNSKKTNVFSGLPKIPEKSYFFNFAKSPKKMKNPKGIPKKPNFYAPVYCFAGFVGWSVDQMVSTDYLKYHLYSLHISHVDCTD